MLKNKSSVSTAEIKKLIKIMNLGHYDILVQEDILGTADEMKYGENLYDISFLNSIITIQKGMDEPTTFITLIHELCHLVSSECNQIVDMALPVHMLDIWSIYMEKANEAHARIIYELVRGEKYDGLKSFSSMVEEREYKI